MLIQTTKKNFMATVTLLDVHLHSKCISRGKGVGPIENQPIYRQEWKLRGTELIGYIDTDHSDYPAIETYYIEENLCTKENLLPIT